MNEEVVELLKSINTKLGEICVETASLTTKADDIFFIRTDVENIRKDINK